MAGSAGIGASAIQDGCKTAGRNERVFDISAKFRSLKKTVRLDRAMKELGRREEFSPVPRKHCLPKPLIVSLTSYNARFETLALTLKSILFQTVQPDATILWLSHNDYPQVPHNVLELRKFGLEIAKCDDMRSYKKIIPTLQNYDNCFIFTVDDDVYYRNDCIERAESSYDESEKHIICQRAHKINITSSGEPKPYVSWDHVVPAAHISPLIFPTGVLGVLYPPDSFHEDVCNVSLFTSLSPSADDVWLYWMWRMKGYLGRKLPDKIRVLEWPGSQVTSLQIGNVGGGANDISVRNLVKKYGFPPLN